MSKMWNPRPAVHAKKAAKNEQYAAVESTPEIDFVIAWVDGSDPLHVASRRRFSLDDEEAHAASAHDTRFRNNGEIYYAIASILKYAPFIRRTYIITDDQKPPLIESFAEARLCDPAFIQLVSHDTIFRELNAARPTFNARSIEAAMWRVPGLSECFVYANDDMFINAPLAAEDFFRDGKPVLHGEMLGPSRRRLKMQMRKFIGDAFGWKDKRPKHLISQELGAALAGMTEEFFHAPHQPHPLRRTVIEKFYEMNPDILQRQVKYRFRNIAQYNAVALSNSLELMTGAAITEGLSDIAYLTPEKSRSPISFLEMAGRKDVRFGCVQSLEQFSAAVQAATHRALHEKFAEMLPSSILELLHNLR